MSKIQIPVLLVLCGAAAIAQTPPVTPDCGPRQYILTGTGTTIPVNNITTGCTVWVVEYQAIGFSAISLSLEGAYGTVVPGTFSSWGGTIVNGVDPQVVSPGSGVTRYSDTAAASSPGYFASFVELNLSVATGSGEVIAVLYGYKAGSAGVAGGGGSGGGGTGCPNPCPVIGVTAPGGAPSHDGVDVNTFDGTDAQRLKSDTEGRLLLGASPHTTPVSLTSSGLTQIVAASGSTVITLTGLLVSFVTSVDFQFEYGTGTNCGTGTNPISGVLKSVLTVAIDSTLSFNVPAGNALCVNLGASVVGGGYANWSQQ